MKRVLFSIFVALVIQSASAAASSVETDLIIFEMTEAIKAGRYSEASEKYFLLEEQGVPLPLNAIYFAGLAYFRSLNEVEVRRNGSYNGSYGSNLYAYDAAEEILKEYAEKAGREGRYYREAIEMLSDLKKWRKVTDTVLGNHAANLSFSVSHAKKSAFVETLTWSSLVFLNHCTFKLIEDSEVNNQNTGSEKRYHNESSVIHLDTNDQDSVQKKRNRNERVAFDEDYYYRLAIGSGVYVESDRSLSDVASALNAIRAVCRVIHGNR